jgi:hypothetical protein
MRTGLFFFELFSSQKLLFQSTAHRVKQIKKINHPTRCNKKKRTSTSLTPSLDYCSSSSDRKGKNYPKVLSAPCASSGHACSCRAACTAAAGL